VTAVVFNPDGEILASGGGDGKIRLWDLQGNSIARSFEIPKSEVTALAFSADGQTLISSSLKGTIHFWRGGGWRSGLQVSCDRLRHHPTFKNPQTDLEKQACRVCQKHIWDRSVMEWNKQGLNNLQAGAFHDAIAAFDRALQIDPYHAGALYNRAKTEIELGKLREAIVDLDCLLQTVPTHATAYFYRAQCFEKLGDRDLARSDCQQAASLYQEQKQVANYKKAIAYLQQL
jgi:tetratricopeptide (TPR) repeat protein